MTDNPASLVERLENDIAGWESAYPLAMFPEPDLKRAAELLKAGGETLDAVSASNMRHVVSCLAPLIREAAAVLTAKDEQITRLQFALGTIADWCVPVLCVNCADNRQTARTALSKAMSNELVEVNDEDRSIYEWLVRRVPTLAAYNQHGHVERMFARHRIAAEAERTAAIAAAASSAPADVREALAVLDKHGVLSDELADRLPEDARNAWHHLTSMYSHRGDGIPTQYTYPPEVRDAAKALVRAALERTAQ
jgi:hypothetical protein